MTARKVFQLGWKAFFTDEKGAARQQSGGALSFIFTIQQRNELKWY